MKKPAGGCVFRKMIERAYDGEHAFACCAAIDASSATLPVNNAGKLDRGINSSLESISATSHRHGRNLWRLDRAKTARMCLSRQLRPQRLLTIAPERFSRGSPAAKPGPTARNRALSCR